MRARMLVDRNNILNLKIKKKNFSDIKKLVGP